MAHALWNYDGACKNIHGHSYKLWVTLTGPVETRETSQKLGMVIDFGDLKKTVNTHIVKRFDHAVVISRHAPHEFLQSVDQMFEKYEITGYQPTSENLVTEFARILIPLFRKPLSLHSIRLQETETSYAEWFASDNS